MKCWKCGNEIETNADVCVYCGVSQSRPAPKTAAGGAMRTLYDRYGAKAVLGNGTYLAGGLGDLRRLAEQNGVEMQIESAPVFRLQLKFES